MEKSISNPLLESQLKVLKEELACTAFEDPQLNEKNYLTTVEAEARAIGMTSLHYTLLLVLHKGSEYLGCMMADYNLVSPNEKLFLDFEGKEVVYCSINDTVVPSKEVFTKRRVQIPAKYQKVGANKLKVVFRNRYAVDGNGLHHFTDPEDKEEYVYSNFEPFSANKMFPCFDQPNLKGSLNLITVTPSNWIVVGNELENSTISVAETAARVKELGIPASFITKELIEQKYVFREFNKVPAISTYLFACIAGPFDFFVSSRKPEEGYPPMRIFVRKSLKKYVEKHVDEFFRITECGVKFYENAFGRKFPFSKHDQIYCPEYNVGAMENVGAVTYTEHYVFKDSPTDERFLRFAETILHELSHMWFGDLVTMKWWNDLWLNESFATFISNLCIAKAPGLEKYKAVWTAFHKYKGWAYYEDQQPTTHPITAVIGNTEDAENIFDGITYMKGASVLKQLYYLVSHEAFCDGIKQYFKIHEWKNTELKDFIGALQEAMKKHGSTIDLDKWVKEWLATKGLNELKPKIEVKDGVVTNFTVSQKVAPNGDNVCRMHMMDIALYDADFKMTTVERVLIEPKEETVIEKIKGMKAPVAVLLNVNDFSYSKIQLDDNSIHAFQSNLNKISDNLTRMIIWRSFWDMVRDGHTSAQEFLKLVVAQLPFEKEESIITGALNYALSATVNYVPKEYSKGEQIKIFEMLEARLKVETQTNLKKHLINYLIGFESTPEHKKLLLKWLNEDTGIEGAPLTPANRYSIVHKIYADHKFTLEEKKKLLDAELAKDKSDEGLRAQKRCEAAIPTAENKEKHWTILLNEKTEESEHMLFSIMSGFNDWEQTELLKPYIGKYFEVIKDVFKKRARSYAERFFNSLAPLDENEEILKKFEDLNGKVTDEEKTLKKLILERIDDIKRILKARKLYLEGIKKA